MTGRRPGKCVAVIGAGMGGLSAALDLAASGFDVTLLERHERPGGKLREIEIAGRGIDSGPTVFTMRWVFEDLFACAGLRLEEHLTLHSAGTLARHSWLDGSRLDLFADIDRSAEAIEAFADRREADAYRRFAAQSEAIFATLDHTFMRCDKPTPVGLSMSLGLRGVPRLYATKPFVSLWNELGRLFRDPRLRQLFGRYATYCGSSPIDAPATLMLIAHAERAGVWFVDGGMQRLADAVASAASDAGAELRFESGVAELRASNGGGFEIILDDGATFAADSVVYNGDVLALEKGMLGPDASGALPTRRKEYRSLSAITWSLLARVADFPLEHHTVFFGGDYPDEFASIFDRGSISNEPTVYVCAQDRGHGARPAPDAEERLFLLVNAPPAALSQDAVQRAEDAAFALLARQGLELRPDANAVQRQTPADFDARYPGSEGAIYGWPTHGWMGSFRRSGAGTAVPGLFCAGGTVHPGPGIPMATLSGRIAADKVRAYLS
jgi:1-hydroxycarotenoid 3,4-desaturase